MLTTVAAMLVATPPSTEMLPTSFAVQECMQIKAFALYCGPRMFQPIQHGAQSRSRVHGQ